MRKSLWACLVYLPVYAVGIPSPRTSVRAVSLLGFAMVACPLFRARGDLAIQRCSLPPNAGQFGLAEPLRAVEQPVHEHGAEDDGGADMGDRGQFLRLAETWVKRPANHRAGLTSKPCASSTFPVELGSRVPASRSVSERDGLRVLAGSLRVETVFRKSIRGDSHEHSV
ncbi:hypothetical protein [Dokdonella soli]|uniref:hypothetical protein n=1 Tax=Dokdonella soli TaxID=529810 RepID=UPI0031D2B01D